MIQFRTERTVYTAHAEAFQLMLYEPKDKSVIAEHIWFWNSRDGVTPFGTTLDGVEYLHAMNAYFPTHWGSIPDAAALVWIDYDQAAWDELTQKKFEKFSANNDEYGAQFRSKFPTLEHWAKAMPFGHGQPRAVTREEFLTSSPSFMGKYA